MADDLRPFPPKPLYSLLAALNTLSEWFGGFEDFDSSEMGLHIPYHASTKVRVKMSRLARSFDNFSTCYPIVYEQRFRYPLTPHFSLFFALFVLHQTNASSFPPSYKHLLEASVTVLSTSLCLLLK